MANANQWSPESYERAFAQSEKEGVAKWVLPNFVAGPGVPRPIAVNFYTIKERYMPYLLCEYDVQEDRYDPVNESQWLNAALLQVRTTGREKFPAFIEWVAIIICNRAEGVAGHPVGETAKVGAIFDINQVFESSRDILALIAQTEMDHRPFIYDPKQPTPGEQQRWLLVERHAAAHGAK